MTEPIIEAEGLVKWFGKVEALAGLDLLARSGQITAVLGPNGAGKTTFVRAVATLIRPDAGRLSVAGIDVARHPEQVRRVIGLAGQYAAVEPTMTGRENLRMVARLFGLSRRQAAASTDQVLSRLGLHDVADRLVKTYSGGLRRRLDLGASLVGVPRLLLLDEPTTGLDPRNGAGTAIGVAEDREQGFFDRLRSLPMPRSALLAGRVLGDSVIVAWGTAITTAMGFLVGFRLHGTIGEALLAFGLCLACNFAFLWMFVCMGLVAANAQAAQGISMVAYPLIFISSAYVRVDTLPGWMHALAAHQPVAVMCNAVRSLALGDPASAGLGHTTTYWVVLSLIWSAAIAGVFAPLAAALEQRKV